MNVLRKTENVEKGQQVYLYCGLCHQLLMEEFYNWSDVQQLLGASDCDHFVWIFVGDPFLDPPWDEETKQIVKNSVADVRAGNGRYFLLPKS